MTEFEDFKPFFDAMIKKMQKKDSEYGDTWKEWDWVYYKDDVPANPQTDEEKDECYTVPMAEHLDNLLHLEMEDYEQEPTQRKRVNIANYVAMRFLRENTD